MYSIYSFYQIDMLLKAECFLHMQIVLFRELAALTADAIAAMTELLTENKFKVRNEKVHNNLSRLKGHVVKMLLMEFHP